MIVGIDAANLRGGGTRTHLIEILSALENIDHPINKIFVWGSSETLNHLPVADFLIKKNPPALNRGLLSRSLWQRFQLAENARKEGCDVLFVPGGAYAGDFHPVVTMSRNMLPFQMDEALRYGASIYTLKLFVLRLVQIRSFRNSEGIIFLTKFAKNEVLKAAINLNAQLRIISHGLNSKFYHPPQKQNIISKFDKKNPFNIVYVSRVEPYKHQEKVIRAVWELRKKNNWPLALDLFGPSNNKYRSSLANLINKIDPGGRWVKYNDEIDHKDLPNIYRNANLGVFASSCENLPNILIEMMGSGLPIACSNKGPMPEVLGNGGVYFNPTNVFDIESAIQKLIKSPELRAKIANTSFLRANQYTWSDCADKTFRFLTDVFKNYVKE